MLGLRLDEPLPLAGLRHALDPAGLARVESLGLAERSARRSRSPNAAGTSAAP